MKQGYAFGGKMMANKLKSEKGYALLWAVMTLLIAVIVISGTLVAGRAFASRNLDDAVDTQTYLSARSATEVIASQINGATITCEEGAVPLYDNVLIPADGETISIDGSSFDFPDGMGKVEQASISRSGDEIIVSSTVLMGEQRDTVEIVLAHTMSTMEVPGGSNPVLLNGFMGVYAGGNLYFDKNDSEMLYFYNADVYAADLKFPGQKELTEFIVDGTFYVKSPNGWRDRLGGDADFQEYPGDMPLADTTEFPSPANYIGGQTVIDLATSSESYFELNASTDTDTIIKVGGDENIYIKIPVDETLHLNLDVVFGDPRIFFIVEGILHIHDTDRVSIYTYGENGSNIKLDDDLTMSGAIHGDKVYLLGNLDFTYIDPADSSGGGEPGSGLTVTMEVHSWGLDKYIFK